MAPGGMLLRVGGRDPYPDVQDCFVAPQNRPFVHFRLMAKTRRFWTVRFPAEERGEADVRLATSIPSSIISVQNALVLEELCAILKERMRATELSADRISCKSTRDVTRGRWFIERQGDLGGQSPPRRVFQNE